MWACIHIFEMDARVACPNTTDNYSLFESHILQHGRATDGLTGSEIRKCASLSRYDLSLESLKEMAAVSLQQWTGIQHELPGVGKRGSLVFIHTQNYAHTY